MGTLGQGWVYLQRFVSRGWSLEQRLRERARREGAIALLCSLCRSNKMVHVALEAARLLVWAVLVATNMLDTAAEHKSYNRDGSLPGAVARVFLSHAKLASAARSRLASIDAEFVRHSVRFTQEYLDTAPCQFPAASSLLRWTYIQFIAQQDKHTATRHLLASWTVSSTIDS